MRVNLNNQQSINLPAVWIFYYQDIFISYISSFIYKKYKRFIYIEKVNQNNKLYHYILIQSKPLLLYMHFCHFIANDSFLPLKIFWELESIKSLKTIGTVSSDLTFFLCKILSKFQRRRSLLVGEMTVTLLILLLPLRLRMESSVVLKQQQARAIGQSRLFNS